MRNKFTLKEGEVQRILELHKQVFLKENGQNILNEEDTVTIKGESNLFEPSGGLSDRLKFYKGTTFKPSTKIKNSLVTTKKVSANLVQYGTFGYNVYAEDNKAFVVYNCKSKNFYLV